MFSNFDPELKDFMGQQPVEVPVGPTPDDLRRAAAEKQKGQEKPPKQAKKP